MATTTRPLTVAKRVRMMCEAGATFLEVCEEYPEYTIKNHKTVDRMIDEVHAAEGRAAWAAKYTGAVLRPWQSALVTELAGIPSTPIIWVHEPVGNTGKSWFAGYLHLHMGAVQLHHKYKYKPDGSRIYVFDLYRTHRGKVDYAGILALKRRVVMPHVICFANWTPEIDVDPAQWDVRRLES